LREAAQSEGGCRQKLEGLQEAEYTELLRAHAISGQEELESSDAIVVRILISNIRGGRNAGKS
jgi:hypothetical protein